MDKLRTVISMVILSTIFCFPLILNAQEEEEEEEYYEEPSLEKKGKKEVTSPFEEEETKKEVGKSEEEGEEEEYAEEEETGETKSELKEELKEEERLLLHSSLSGETGLLRVVTAYSGAPLTFSTSLTTNFFLKDDYLIREDSHNHVGGNFAISFVPWKYIETYFSASVYAHSNNMESPRLFQTLGDMILGAKGFYPVLNWLYVGGGFDLYFLNKVGDVGISGSSTGFGLKFLTSFDIKRLKNNVPLRFHLNFGYVFDNSYKLVADVEEHRGGCDETTDRGCITRIERTSLNISRVDRFNIRLGIESPLPYVSPFVEWNLGIPVNRQGFDCTEPTGDNGGSIDGDDSCLAVEGFSAFPQTIAIGVRVFPVIRGLALNLAAEIGLTGVETFVHELPATPPYNIFMGVSYAYDPKPRVVEKVKLVKEEKECEKPLEAAKIIGTVKDVKSGEPIPDAIVTFSGLDVGAVATDSNGKFVSWPLPAGEITVHVKANNYHEKDCKVQLPETGEVELECALEPLPKKGILIVQVKDEEEQSVSGAIVYAIDASGNKFSIRTDASGTGEIQLEQGLYDVRVEAEGFMLKQRQGVELRSGAQVTLEIQVRHKPKKALVKITKDQIKILKQVHFRTNSAEIDPDSHALLEEIADVILRNPELCKIEIQGHTDNVGKREYNIELSQKRADAVRDFLIQAGVAPERLTSKGFGPDVPIAPNVLPTGRAKNRRVELHIIERCPAQ